jgi:hypothetical protein
MLLAMALQSCSPCLRKENDSHFYGKQAGEWGGEQVPVPLPSAQYGGLRHGILG